MGEPAPVLNVENVSVRFGGVRALSEVSFQVQKGEIFSIIGPNGAGKTSMLNCISGRYKPTEGEVFFRGNSLAKRSVNDRADLGIGRTFQNLALFGHMTVLDNIMVGRHHLLKNNFLTGAIYWLVGAQKEELSHRLEVEEIIDFLEIQAVRNAVAGTLSYGLRKRVELARAVALKPDLLLLDEPMAGMNLEEKEDMARFIMDLNAEWRMSVASPNPCGDFRTSYRTDTTIFQTRWSFYFCLAGIALAALSPLFLDSYYLTLMIQIGYLGIAALGLNILVGFTGQISLGHSAFFGFGAFASAWINTSTGIPVFFSIPLAGVLTTAVGMIFGVPASRIKGLYLAIATLASQFILQDFFARAEWFTGGAAGALAEPFSIFGFVFDTDERFLYVVLVYLIVMYVGAANLMRSRDGRALVAVRDHYLSAEMMGINLAKYRILSFGISSFYAGVGGALFAHYLQYVSVEGFDILLSIQFLGMIIIGGLGSIMGSLMGTAFMVLLPEVMEAAMATVGETSWGNIPALLEGLPYLKEMAVGLAIILFLIFEPDGLAHRWRLIKAYWKLYPFSY